MIGRILKIPTWNIASNSWENTHQLELFITLHYLAIGGQLFSDNNLLEVELGEDYSRNNFLGQFLFEAQNLSLNELKSRCLVFQKSFITPPVTWQFLPMWSQLFSDINLHWVYFGDHYSGVTPLGARGGFLWCKSWDVKIKHLPCKDGLYLANS